MDKTPLLVWLLLSLSACEPGGRSISHSQTVNDETIISTRVRAWDDHGRFECRGSQTGACRVVVFACKSDARQCPREELTRFLLKPGESRMLEHLPRHWDACMDSERRPQAVACRPGES
jgi:hypothetical protein